MPYTLVHPGFILPFARWLPKFFYLPALIVGSFIPDFDIIYRFSQTRYHLFTYTTSNIFLEIMPMGIVLTYFFSYILIPISEKGEIEISINTSSIKSYLLSLPKIVLNLIVAIYLHLFLDSYFHIKNIIDISEQIALDLGYGQNKVKWVYYSLLYIPQIFISSIGACLLLFSFYLFRKEIKSKSTFLRTHLSTTILLFILVALCFSSMKIIKAGFEKSMQMDSLMIGITTGLMSAFFITPLCVWAFTRVKMLKSVLLGILLTLSVYMLGLVYKEYLSIYIVKGVFIIISAFIAYTIVYLRQKNKKLILLLLIDFIMLIFHPFTSYFSYLLTFKFILLILSIYFFEEKEPLVFHRKIINGLIIGSIISLAFYASNKGLGYGILICFSAPLFHFTLDNRYDEGWKNILYKTIPTFLFSILIFSIYPKLGVLTLFCLSLTGCFLIVFKEVNLPAFHLLFFGIIFPFISVLYLALFFSKAYAIFSGSIILINLLLYHFSNDMKKLES